MPVRTVEHPLNRITLSSIQYLKGQIRQLCQRKYHIPLKRQCQLKKLCEVTNQKASYQMNKPCYENLTTSKRMCVFYDTLQFTDHVSIWKNV